MANLKEIRTRIVSVKSTRQITNAMKMVSAAKLRKAQDAIIQLRPYARKMHEILSHVSSVNDSEFENVLAENREPDKILILLVSSNRGLCGPFNANISKKALELVQNQYSAQLANKSVDFMTIGKKAGDVLKSKSYKISGNYDYIYDSITYEEVSKIAEDLMQMFIDRKYDKIDIIYNGFKNAAVQIITHETVLPVSQDDAEHAPALDYIFEPDYEYIVENLMPESIKINLFAAILDSNAAEQGARMTAMHKATDNATDLIKDLTLSYNKARQAAITSEILEITAGAEALKS